MTKTDYEIRRAASDADMQKRLDKFILRHNVDSIIRNGRLHLIISHNALEAFCVEFGINEIINCKIIDGELNVEVKALFDKMPEEYNVEKYGA
ncbi:MAG TPA: hypothetical protein PKL77_08525 [Candidatus Omnitrophota bacterium]|nr:hypothetical protein [Candidatus Omnitrophota bacterium]